MFADDKFVTVKKKIKTAFYLHSELKTKEYSEYSTIAYGIQ